MEVLVPGGRDVRATLDDPTVYDPDDDSERRGIVVACPPHPQFGGDRTDRRLRAVSDALDRYGVSCLRIDYGEWDRGRGERIDAENAVVWARERYLRVGLFGYSFGGAVALLAAAALDPGPDAVSALAPASHLGDEGEDDLDAVTALVSIHAPVQVVYGERDETADWRPVVDRAHELGHAVEGLSADHHFVGQSDDVGATVAGFLADTLDPTT